MHRRPSLHVTLADLQDALRAMGHELSDYELSELAFRLRGNILQNRQVIVTNNARTAQAVQRKQVYLQEHAKIAAACYANFSLKEFGRNAFYGPNDKMWAHIEVLSRLVEQFAEHFEIDVYETACNIFLAAALATMERRFKLPKINAYSESIWEHYEAQLVVSTDVAPELTEKFMLAYAKRLRNFANVDLKYLADAKYKMHLVYGRLEADGFNANYTDWIKAQEEGLAFADTFPDVYQMYGNNARKRYIDYCKKHSRSFNGKATAISNDYISRLKKLRDGN